MKKIADFIVNKRYIVLGVMLTLCIACVCMIPGVNVNTDMTKYLPDDSSMKQGMNILGEEFPGMSMPSTIRVMFKDLTDVEKTNIKIQLSEIENVDSVTYNPDIHDKDGYTLYTVSTSYAYNTPEEIAIEEEINWGFDGYEVVYQNDDAMGATLPLWVIGVAFALLMLVLFIMCSSWFEPLLFLATIGVAVGINMGSNIMFSSVSQMTYSVASILQVVLSMDYSIILMNRYRQEKKTAADKYDAMKIALRNSFSSVASSGMTTVIGLLMLIFMSFTIGMDLGLVLSKGVLLSMLSVFTVLPVLILIFDKVIEKTAKKELHVPMGKVAGFSYKGRKIIAVVFVVLFISTYFLQNITPITYTISKEDEISEIFPTSNPIVMIYDNRDEEKIAPIANALTEHEKVNSVLGYSTTLGKAFTTNEMVAMIESLGADMGLDPSILSVLYYDRFAEKGDKSLAVGDVLRFVSENVMTNEMFSSFIDDSMKDKAGLLGKFSDKEALTAPMTSKEIADVFGMEEKLIKQVMALYYASETNENAGTMTVAQFADFVVNNISKDEMFSSFIDADMKEKLGLLSEFSDKNKVKADITADALASKLGIDAQQAKLLYAYYYAGQESYTPSSMTATEFVNYLKDEIISNPMLSSQIDPETAAQAGLLVHFATKESVQKQRSAEEIASLLGIDESVTKAVFVANFGTARNKTMSLEEFVDYIADNFVGSPLLSGMIDADLQSKIIMMQKLIDAVVSGESVSYTKMSEILSMDPALIKILYSVYDFDVNGVNKKLSVHKVINFLGENKETFAPLMGEENLALIEMGEVLVNGAVSGKSFTSNELADSVGIEPYMLRLLFMLRKAEKGDTSKWKLSMQDFVGFISEDIVSDETYSAFLDEEMTGLVTTADGIIDAVVESKSFTAKELAGMLGSFSAELDENMVSLMYLYYSAVKESNPEWKLTIEELFDHLYNNMLNDERFSVMIDESMKKQILGAKGQLEDGVSQMVGKNHSLMMIDTTLALENEETTAFMQKLFKDCDAALGHDYYVIGNSPMSYEMAQTFDTELLMITLLTALAIFVVVAITFRKLIIPLMLVLLVQTGVYITVFASGVRGYDMYYLALLVVECVLMGATIDYGILYTNYYRDCRKTMEIKEALNAAFDGSSHTIFTSGLIMVFVTGVLGFAPIDPTIAQICQTVSIGCLSAILLILFILPGLLAAFDKFVIKERKKKNK